MKKLLIVLFCLAIFNAGCRQKTERYNMNEVGHKNGINYVKSTMEPVNGIVYGEDENGQLMLEANFKDGRYHGFARTWHENGELHTESSWKDEKEDGVFSIWYENGQKEMEENYVDGKLITARNSSNTPIPNIGAPIQFGAFLGKYEFAKGQLDEIAIWNRALSFGEISSIVILPSS